MVTVVVWDPFVALNWICSRVALFITLNQSRSAKVVISGLAVPEGSRPVILMA